ncbi:serine-type D-Ala-D-Ala carboxypeptidase (penicillin-binding protein 5/6) [Gammaproteobacteria bacterium]
MTPESGASFKVGEFLSRHSGSRGVIKNFNNLFVGVSRALFLDNVLLRNSTVTKYRLLYQTHFFAATLFFFLISVNFSEVFAAKPNHATPATAKESATPAGSAASTAKAGATAPIKGTVIPAPPQVAAGAWTLMDADTGRVFAENNADTRVEPASLTKIMTAYVVFNAIHSGEKSLTDSVRISEHAWKTGGSRTYLDLGSQVPLETVLLGMIVQSGNDASVALAEHIAGTEQAFSDLMNHHAEQIGMVNSHFENATGLPGQQHYSSAHDLALLSKSLIQRFPEEYKIFSVKEFTYNGIVQHNRDVLLRRDESVDGIKTGFTDRAGYCLVSSAKREEMRLISVVMNTKSPAARAREAQALLDYGFRFWETHRVHVGRQPMATTRVWKGAQRELAVGTAQDIHVTVPRGSYKTVTTNFEIQNHIVAPVNKNQTVGTMHVTLPDGKVEDYPLVAIEEIALGSWWRRLVDMILMWFNMDSFGLGKG